MQRDPERIERMMKLMKSAWKSNSHMRFGGFLMYALASDTNIYYMEDDVLEQHIKDFYYEKD